MSALHSRFSSVTARLPCPDLPTLPSSRSLLTTGSPSSTAYPVVALGGTFDHLHAAHKLLLHLSLFLSTRKLIVGVMSDHLLKSKSNAALVQPLAQRIRIVEDFLVSLGAVKAGSRMLGVVMDVVEIQDPYGPTAWDDDIQALVVSKETSSGGRAVQALRKEKGLSELEVFTIDVIGSMDDLSEKGEAKGTHGFADDTDEQVLKDLKMGSSAIRQWITDHHASEGRDT